MGPSDPPGTTYIPGLRQNLHGLFAVNLGVYVLEVGRATKNLATSWVQDYHCCIRSRLAELMGFPGKELWWEARADTEVIAGVRERIHQLAFPFLNRYGSRDGIIEELGGRSDHFAADRPPRIVLAIILLERGQKDNARQLLAAQAREAEKRVEPIGRHHAAYVRELAGRLGLGELGV